MKGYPLDDAMVGITPDKLRELYWYYGYSLRDVAKYFGISKGAIDRRMNRWHIPVRINPHCPNVSNGYKGGRFMRGDYWVILSPNHPRNNHGYVYEHILVYEKSYLPPCEFLPLIWIVHHINGIKTDNRPENLASYPRETHDKLIPLMAQRIRQLEVENNNLKDSKIIVPDWF